MDDDVTNVLLALAGGDPFDAVRIVSESHQREHRCGPTTPAPRRCTSRHRSAA